MNKVIILVLIFNLLISNIVIGQIDYSKTNKYLLDSLMKNDEKLYEVWEKAVNYKIQIIYTKVLKNLNEKPQFQNFSFNLSNDLYFYPASLVKLPISIFTLEKLERLKSFGVNLDSKLSIEKNYSCQLEVIHDRLSDNFTPTLRNYLLKALIVSDNESYNRLYEFVGQEYTIKRIAELGYENARIITRFSGCDSTENRHTNGFKFFNSKDELIYYQQPAISKISLSPPIPNMKLGEGHLSKGKVLQGSKDFSAMNFLPLKDIHDILIRLVYPNLFKDSLLITDNNRKFILECLMLKPKDCSIKKIASDKLYYDFYTNYLYYGSDRNAKENTELKIYNIVGQSYGFLSDIAYFKDEKNNISFFLSAVIYTNSSGIIGKDSYEYITIGLPFLRDLGKCIYNYEISQRK